MPRTTSHHRLANPTLARSSVLLSRPLSAAPGPPLADHSGTAGPCCTDWLLLAGRQRVNASRCIIPTGPRQRTPEPRDCLVPWPRSARCCPPCLAEQCHTRSKVRAARLDAARRAACNCTIVCFVMCVCCTRPSLAARGSVPSGRSFVARSCQRSDFDVTIYLLFV